MADTVRKEIEELRRQVAEAAEAVESRFGTPRKRRRQFKRVQRKGAEMSTYVRDQAQRHPVYSGLLVLGIVAGVACLLCYSSDDRD